jgi:hypothetical protein
MKRDILGAEICCSVYRNLAIVDHMLSRNVYGMFRDSDSEKTYLVNRYTPV